MTGMKHLIDPMVDYAFKKILGAKGNEDLLLDFVNSILALASPIGQLELINPFNDKDYQTDKLSIVDIKATDTTGRIFQIEVQLTTPKFLQNRILHNWSDIYQSQLNSGQGYAELKPTISIWLLSGVMFKSSEHFHSHFELWDVKQQTKMTDHLSIHILELEKWHKPDTLQQQDFWLYFFKCGKQFKFLPKDLHKVLKMRQAMGVLRAISEKQQDYFRYQARQQFLRIQKDEKDEKEALALELAQKRETLAQQQETIAQQQEKLQLLEAKLRETGISVSN